mmetsp:Transcript_27159/g.68280  ORF Transcript_27159/g.68280 Transcript_27159/m.68280 type:complete len:237 (+) Transcript_27159:216-926(+)
MASADGGAAAATSQVVWVQNKQGNTGKGGGLAELLGHIWRGRDRPGDAEGILVQRPSSAEALRKYAADKGWVEFPCPLSNFLLGAKDKIVIWAAPLDAAKEHRGKNNVVATYLAAEMDGLARGTICGRALVACTDGEDMTYGKVVKLLAFINDMIDHWTPGVPPKDEELRQNARQLFPFYQTAETGNDTFCNTHLSRIVRVGDEYDSTGYFVQNRQDMARLREVTGPHAWPAPPPG